LTVVVSVSWWPVSLKQSEVSDSVLCGEPVSGALTAKDGRSFPIHPFAVPVQVKLLLESAFANAQPLPFMFRLLH
jgi:hypothetical protein